MSVNFAKYQDDIIRAWKKVTDERGEPNWALYSYEGHTNVIKLMSTGCNGLAGLVQEFNCSLIQYAFCRVIDVEHNLNKLVLINWQGDSAPLSRKGLCASHVGDVANYFKGATQTITIRNDDEATVDYLMSQIIKSRPIRLIDSCVTKQAASQLEQTLTKTDNSSMEQTTTRQVDLGQNAGEQIAKERKSFWQLQEEEERLRIEEEKKRAAEKEAQFLKERLLREQSEAKRLAETVKERDRLIEATRNAEKRESTSSISNSNLSSYASFNSNHQINRAEAKNSPAADDDDERVGRRSELIRLERNQETQSLIGKGQIKNRRALFEKATHKHESAQNFSNTLSRRPSGAMIRKRLDAFQSLDQNGGTARQQQSVVMRQVEKIIDRTSNLTLKGDHPSNSKPNSANDGRIVVTSAIESVKLIENDEHYKQSAKFQPDFESPQTKKSELSLNSTNGITNGLETKAEESSVVLPNGTSKTSQVDKTGQDNVVIDQHHDELQNTSIASDDDDDDGEYQRELEQTKQAESCLIQKKENGVHHAICNVKANSNENGNGMSAVSDQNVPSRSPSPQDASSISNGDEGNSSENNNHITVSKSPDELVAFRKIVDALMANEDENERSKARAVAIYDYQAADKTEISFDPNDLIGYIEKVDVGWWHGVVLTGKYVGERGLFPHNHVLEF